MSDEKKIVLIVEDDAFIRDIYSVKFSQEGYQTEIATNGIEALSKLEKIFPDIIILDVVMPHMDGMETLRNIKKNDRLKNIPIIMLTNVSEKEKIDESMEGGVEEYLIKSHFAPSEIVEKVNSLLNK
ncbi:MAG TPA: response regulator [Candidatus Moranbacteria bacterium]|jgi:CheY-like chemotaxis protein|nr:response regulator [Candidatus Moranbacteria bacterium]HPX94543.1 response regulator [Candidatus Moranbacteria bacterium]HQB59941.1 response regulator [Candidatus Moranbacteria bacterium]